MAGVSGRAFPTRSLRTITTVRPAGAIFFCALAYIRPNFDTSTGSERIDEDISATSGMFPVSGI